jgi:DNA-binding protein HU-beta
MTKANIVNEVSKMTGVEKITVQKITEAFMESIESSMAENKNIYLRGFGSFIVKKRAQKTARNISQNTTVIVPAHLEPVFKPAKILVSKIKSDVKESKIKRNVKE